jgi:hypothetical protein
MCLIIDTCCIHRVFNVSSKEHAEFAPVLKWITRGKGRMLYGGRKYKEELRAMTSYLRLFTEFQRQGKLVEVVGDKVDEFGEALKKRVPDKSFNDEHIVALVAISRCRVVCTDDKLSMPYLKRRDLYPADVKPPKIYTARSHAKLCCDKHVVDACR